MSGQRPDAQGGAFLENRRGAGNLARSRLSGGSWAMSEPSWPEGRLKAGCSQDWLPIELALADHVDCFVALNRSPSRLEFSEALLGVHSTFDGSMILFENFV